MDVKLFREQLEACLKVCFLIGLEDTNLQDEMLMEACQSGEQPFEVANYFAEKHGLSRGDESGRFGVPEYRPMTLADQERAIARPKYGSTSTPSLTALVPTSRE
jgi:hypothetical protein